MVSTLVPDCCGQASAFLREYLRDMTRESEGFVGTRNAAFCAHPAWNCSRGGRSGTRCLERWRKGISWCRGRRETCTAAASDRHSRGKARQIVINEESIRCRHLVAAEIARILVWP